MTRQVITTTVTIAGTGYAAPAKTLTKGQVVELSAAELSAVTTAGGAVRATSARDQLGESAGASNSN
jgi:hypothetical protein